MGSEGEGRKGEKDRTIFDSPYARSSPDVEHSLGAISNLGTESQFAAQRQEPQIVLQV